MGSLLEDILFVETRNNPGSYFGANDRGAQSQSLKDQGKSRTWNSGENETWAYPSQSLKDQGKSRTDYEYGKILDAS